MEFNSLPFLLFFPCITIIYYLLPQRIRVLFLFITSLMFYMFWNVTYILLLGLVILVSYCSAILIEKSRKKTKKFIICLNVIECVVVLFLFKYFGMFSETIEFILKQVGGHSKIEPLNLLLPVGISFYTFQALGYVIDVYRGDVKAEKNFIVYGAFLSFFPQLVAGPIERSKNLLKQMHEKHEINPDKMTKGFLQMLWGYFQKVVIADRIAVIVTAVYNDYQSYSGVYIVVATVLFAFQIYCDFDGYTNIAIGAARILGFDLIKNFNVPYLATGIADFWDRWHISLSKWLRDYIYIPLGGNRGTKWFKYRNLLITFLVSGIWHGANWTYLVWGALHGLLRIGDDMIAKNKKIEKWNCWIKRAITFVLVDFAWLFFRANSLSDVFAMLQKVVMNFDILSLLNRDMAISMGMVVRDIVVLIFALIVLLILDNHKAVVYEKYKRLPLAVRWCGLYCIIFGLLIFGYYGPTYDAAQFIYFQF